MKITFKQPFILLVMLANPLLVYADTTDEEVVKLDTISATTLNNDDLVGQTFGYTTNSSNIATRTKLPLLYTGQAVSVVTRQQIEDQRLESLSEALNYSAGAFSGLVGAARRYDYVAIRGFNENMTDNVLIDGQRLLSDSNTYSSMQIDPYFIERIDLIKGPVSSSYGRATPGGLVAATTKRPLHEAYHEINVFGGNRDQHGMSFDLTDTFDKSKNISYRLTGLLKKSHSQNDDHRSNRYAISPSLSWNISPSTNLLLQAYFQNDPRAGYHGGLPAEGTINSYNGFKFSRSFSDAEPSDQFHRRQQIFSTQLTHMFAPDWIFASKIRFADVHTYSKQTWQLGWADTSFDLYRAGGETTEHLKSWSLDNSITGKFKTGSLQHEVVIGSDYQHRKTESDAAYNYSSIPMLNVLNPRYGMNVGYTDYPSYQTLRLRQLGFYVRENMQFGQWFASIGLRHDRVSTSITNRVTGLRGSEYDGGKTTWNASLLYAFENGISPYINYSTGFNPNTYSDINGKLLQPTESAQWEAGIKYQPEGSNSLYTLSFYDLRQKNVANRVVNGNYYIPSGQVNSKGIEFEAKIDVTEKWFVQTAIAYNQTKFKHSTIGLDGKTPYQSPKLTAALWSNYNFDNGLSINGGVRHVSGVWADHANTLKVPPVTLVDIGVKYDLGSLNSQLKGLQTSISINNLFDKKYVSSCAGLNYCYYGEGRNILANIAYKW
ncbi:ferrioxamine B receptor [Pelistega indica]|uniref:Ferrioxamine B receptor n=1 Tax=Pelistega indica TaxID=1414851 RepID=V8G494_9BURK|nr:TonB-dependent siderophore receptor [Pelistega indica]ETD71354.1 ferrioxamine B receptor [Pelistega indica]